MKNDSRNGIVALLLTLLLVSGASIGNASENSSNMSDAFVHPGIGMDCAKTGYYKEAYLDSYGILPEFKSEEEKKEFYRKVKQVKSSVSNDLDKKLAEIEIHTNNTGPGMDLVLIEKTAKEHNIDVSDNLAKYFIEDQINSWGVNKEGYIGIGLNVENTDQQTRDEIYLIYYKKGIEMGIENIPVVFENFGTIEYYSETDEENTGIKIPVQENDDLSVNRASGAGILLAISVTILAFLVGRRKM
ncbi:hypothetical protein MSSIT_0356 [Methanosarcina siciliae T4/M]|uniref:Uncharacterized protein n=1 Tax=Methanosarcina siciliae T4/M TaxID=1434120 RepID=A0A0E3P177_9EURY|nr:hypothetical protein [Methanosarcina siciliae]AKB27075.1 hypothetical protein MSSIT_0356 [Methanosarcina siciliae T4/M]